MKLVTDKFKCKPDFVQSTEPQDPWIGCSWFDTSGLFDTVKVWTGSMWRWGGTESIFGSNMGFIAGGLSLSTVDRILFPFDNGQSVTLNNLMISTCLSGACNSSQFGYLLAGYTTGFISNIQRLSFDGTVSYVGNLLQALRYNSSVNSSIHGFSFGANYPSGSTSASFICRMLFSMDGTNATNQANLQSASHSTAAFNETSYGYMTKGYQSGSYISSVERIMFPFDSGPTILINSVRSAMYFSGAFNSSQFGYVSGGMTNGTTYSSSIDRVTFTWNSGAMTTVGNCSSSGYRQAACNSLINGFTSINNSGNSTSLIERVMFPFDSGTTLFSGNVSNTKLWSISFDNTDFVGQFV